MAGCLFLSGTVGTEYRPDLRIGVSPGVVSERMCRLTVARCYLVLPEGPLVVASKLLPGNTHFRPLMRDLFLFERGMPEGTGESSGAWDA